MVFALRNYNEQFLKYSLRENIFPASFLNLEQIKDELFSILK
jgi:hypothetical protein